MKHFFTTLIFIALTSGQALLAKDTPLLKGEIQSINSPKQVSINIGSDQGVITGTIFKAYGKNQVYRIPLTQEVLVEEGQVVGQLKVIHVAPRFCQCEIIEDFKPYLGQLVLGRPLSSTGNRSPQIKSITWDSPIIQWGKPVHIHVEGHDPENMPLTVNGVANSGLLIPFSKEVLTWYPPKTLGKTKINLQVSDGIGIGEKSLYLTHDQTILPKFSQKASHIYGPQLFPFKKIDQFHINRDGYLWILDKNEKIITTLSPAFDVLQTIDLKQTSPERFSISEDKIAILDGRKQRVLIYDHNGQPLGRIGQKGDLVHQWQHAGDILLLPNNHLTVLDTKRQTVVVYDEQGRFQACVGYPSNQSPGFLGGSQLTSHGDGFAVIDRNQHSRLIFDKNFKYVETFPLGELDHSIIGSYDSNPASWPEGIELNTLIGVSHFSENSWIASDRNGKRLWFWEEGKTLSQKFFDWEKIPNDQYLFSGKENSDQVYWLNKKEQKILSIDVKGWRQHINLPSQLEHVTSFFIRPDTSPVWLDGDSCRIFNDKYIFGQKGSGTGMMDEPAAITIWNNNIVVLDTGNEKVLIFSQDGLLVEEREFKNCLAFCKNSKNELIILCDKGQGWIWKPSAPPEPLALPQGKRIKAIYGGYLVISKHQISMTDEIFNILQTIPFKRKIEDAIESPLGELWAITKQGILRFPRE